ncbi:MULTISPECIES: DUF3313 domain-containing protein [Brenneria]|uniref:DUF3313 domain-containing protein n=1 Tax=Brenneria nigrifluens DSM 30175 = ATCC 13028 TaxID=1121120 RepID=A0A2U1UC59_9GAMM|nr:MULTISPECIES: DUF3313 domain-containing protein [Brenneria]EHD20843.1 putative lipoprotein [Brenneria sp. EniD312]PWC19255.1 DUF3313 domain-containing protein [Brenneria nigrifluens DSM 30175 = ATCC 13028]QCR04008.1 DUF3313 domain-containing protein [Brenneria nigrifluens DSM 30175 = ATCC 13028]
MNLSTKAFRSAILTLGIALAGCAGTQPALYSGIDSSPQLRPNSGDESDRIPYRYATPVDWKQYANVIIEPVVIYQGADNQFDDIEQEDRQALALYMQNTFINTLKTRFQQVNTAAPHTLRIKLTLTGAETTTQVAGTVTKFDLAGGPYNIVQSIRGKQGMLGGSVSYAVEIYDAQTNRLLNAYVAKQYPNALNVGATIGSLSAAEVGIDKGAEELLDMLK